MAENLDVREVMASLPHKHVTDGVVSVDGRLLYVHIFGTEDHTGALTAEQRGVFSMIEQGDFEHIFQQHGLEVTPGNVQKNKQTYARYLLENEIHPRFTDPEILDKAIFEPYYGLGYAWPLEDVIDELGEADMCIPWGRPEGDNVAANNGLNQKLAERILQLSGEVDGIQVRGRLFKGAVNVDYSKNF